MFRTCCPKSTTRRRLIREVASSSRAYSAELEGGNALANTSTAIEHHTIPSDKEDFLRLRRRTEWKRRQGGENFIDQKILHVRGGRGGDACAAFHREKWKPMGPPSGGNGGHGSSIYLLPSPHITTLSSIPRIVKGAPGAPGGGTWQNGRDGEPVIIKVPLGTIVKELPRDDPRRAKDARERFEESLEGMEENDRIKTIRQRRWVHYPGFEDDNLERETFKEADKSLALEEKAVMMRRKRREKIFLDLDKVVDGHDSERGPDAPLGTPRSKNYGYLIAEGGGGGLGNPHFLHKTNRSPKIASRGMDGEWVSVELELKILADVALVGIPNAGKSTLVRALTGGRVKSQVADYAFTTLNPILGVVRIGPEGWIGGEEGQVYEETVIEERRSMEMDIEARVAAGHEDDLDSLSKAAHTMISTKRSSYESSVSETFRFTITDNPGLIEHASQNKGLGHSFLRSIERSHALVYVVDLSSEAPWDELRVLRDELEKYREGMSGKARMILANKADLLGGEEGEQVEEARRKLSKLEEYVKTEMRVGVDGVSESIALDVVPVSAKYSMNLRKVVGLMMGYVEEAREKVALEVESERQLVE